MKEHLDKLIEAMQKEKLNEPFPGSAAAFNGGLNVAINITKNYAEHIFDYEYEISAGVWFEVKNKDQLIKLEELGFHVRRKKPDAIGI